MTQEDKELLLKDLCARLPYHTNLYSEYADDNWAILTPVVYAHTANCSPDKIGIKPYLFPMSSMTAEQKREYVHLLNCTSNISMIQITGESTYDWLNKNMFDWRGLIPKGLANDATGLGIYKMK